MKVKSKMDNPKGVKDYTLKESKERDQVEGTIKEAFDRYGFSRLETSILNTSDVLTAKYAGGAEIVKEMYQVEDQGDSGLALRYDLTVPFMKYVSMNCDGDLPIKRYEIGKVFRNGPVKKGRLREFTQCDVDVVGIKSVMAEAELIQLAKEVFDELNLDIVVKVNNVKVMEGLLEKVGVEKEKYKEVILSIDKLDKIGKDGVISELKEKGIESEIIEKLFNGLDGLSTIGGSTEELNECMVEGMGELKELTSLVDVEYSPYLARGLEIYTGTVYEFFVKDSEVTSSVGSGGRYDGKIDKFMTKDLDLPAVGLSLGIDVIYEVLKEKGIQEVGEVSYYVIPMGTEKETFDLVRDWRNEGIRMDMEMDRKKVSKAMKFADKKGYNCVMVIGEREIEDRRVEIKNLRTGEKNVVGFDEL